MLVDYPIDRISHIGSTAIQGIWAKDIVDVLIEIPTYTIVEVASSDRKEWIIRMSADDKRVYSIKGIQRMEFADKVYHIHLRYTRRQ